MSDFEKVRSEALFPPTAIANDGKTKLKRYRVDAVIYAPNIEAARRRLREANMILDGATIRAPRKPAAGQETGK
jgi:hypothetical protein